MNKKLQPTSHEPQPMRYTPVIGLEVHVELNTKSKMFCGCANDWFGKEPNTHTCPVCLGLPGALPVPNKKAIEGCIKIGIALNCEIPLLSKFDRKNYFYPDLAKGYQISQYDQPFAQNGFIMLSNGKKIGIRRAHMEEDTGKLMHETIKIKDVIARRRNDDEAIPQKSETNYPEEQSEKVSLIDYNRSGVPLVEIVTEPDFTSASEVKEYLQKLQQIVRYIGVADANMEKGEMRLEPNISLRVTSLRGETTKQSRGIRSQTNHNEIASLKDGLARNDELPNYKVEVKNINSFSFVEKAIEYEIKRQAEILDKGELPKQETRGWDEDKHMTISQRSKEEAADYRYFPEPDIPPFVWKKPYIEALRKELPELPDEKRKRFVEDFKLSEYNAEILTREQATADFFEEAVKKNQELRSKNQGASDEKTIANWIINKKIDLATTLPATMVKEIIESDKVEGIDEKELEAIIKQVLDANQKVVDDYKGGKTNAVMFLVGQSMAKLKGKAKADKVKAKLEEILTR